MHDDKYSILRRYFGYDSFRQGQEKLIDAILAGRDCLGIMPTGGGKSLCYQVPALLLDGLTIVVTPLISLMNDQVAALRENGVAAACISSALSSAEYAETLRGLGEGKYKLLYIAPERLETASFKNTLARLDVPLIAVDEAHCVSQWGPDFRPSYLKIGPAIAAMRRRPTVAAFTATATDLVRGDIIDMLGLRDPMQLVTGFDRPNLYFEVRSPANKNQELLQLLAERRDRSGIIYCGTRATVDKVCELLRRRGFNAVRYHAGLSDDERAGAQEAFQYDKADIMVATNAFGMGIDKSNVGYVIHYNMPKSIDAYYQEAGRAGRDGSDADCILLYSSSDAALAMHLLNNSENGPSEADLDRLSYMRGYCSTAVCLRGYILGYFGQEHPERCGNCGNCNGDNKMLDITIAAQQAMSCIQRIKKRLGYNVGRKTVVDTLLGASTPKVLEHGLTELSTFGLMSHLDAAQVNAVLDALLDNGLAQMNEYRAIVLTQKAAGVLYHGERVQMLRRVYAERSQRRRRAAAKPVFRPSARSGVDGVDSAALFECLRRVRAEIAREAAVPAYVVFSNSTLQEMAELVPVTWDELLSVPGVGEKKAERYGRQFLEEIARFIRL